MGITDSTGTASCTITPGEVPANNYTLTGTYAGSTATYPAQGASNNSEPFNVTIAPTALTYTGATTSVSGGPATLSGNLTSNGSPVAGQTLAFTIGGGPTLQTCSGSTNSSGTASCTIASVNQTAGSVPVAATFAGTAYYTSSNAPGGTNLTVGSLTTLKVSNVTGVYGAATTVSALLTNSNTSAAVNGEPVTLTVSGTDPARPRPPTLGRRRAPSHQMKRRGPTLTGTFAGDTTKPSVLYASSGSANFVVTPALTTLTYTGATTVVNGAAATLSGQLTTGGARAGR